MGCYRIHKSSLGITTYIKLLFKNKYGYVCDQYRISDRVIYSRIVYSKGYLFSECESCSKEEFDLIKEL